MRTRDELLYALYILEAKTPGSVSDGVAWLWRRRHGSAPYRQLATHLNGVMGTKHSPRRLQDWVAGRRPVPSAVLVHMMVELFGFLLDDQEIQTRIRSLIKI